MRVRFIVPGVALAGLILAVSSTSAQTFEIFTYRDFKRANDYIVRAPSEVGVLNNARKAFYERMAKGGPDNDTFNITGELLARYRQISPLYTPFVAEAGVGNRPRPVVLTFPRPNPEYDDFGVIPVVSYPPRTKAEFDGLIEERRLILDTLSKINRRVGTLEPRVIPPTPGWAATFWGTLFTRFDNLNLVLDSGANGTVVLYQNIRLGVFEESALRREASRIDQTIQNILNYRPDPID